MDSTPNCQYSNTFNILRTYRFDDNVPNGVWINVEYVGNGVSCNGTEVVRATPGAPGQTREKSSACTNKVTDGEGRQSYSCLATDVNKEPGEMNCGEVNGVFKCIPSKPSPALTDKKVETDVTETTNPDGSKSTETTTTTTITSCTGANSCTTTTTVNTHNAGTNSDGSPGGESSSCTGPGCSNGTGTPEETTDTPETPEEPCDPATDPNACGNSSVAGEACDAPVVCTGDAIQCAILRQQKAARCAQDQWQDVDPAEIKQAVAGEFSGPEYEPLEAGEGGTFDLSDMIDTSSSISASCPAMPSINFNLAGSSQSLDFDFIMLELCKYAEWFGFLMVAFAMYRAAEIVAGGFS